MRGVLIRSAVVLGIGVAVLSGILYYASTVDRRSPLVQRIALTQQLGGEERVGLTTTAIEVHFSEPVVTRTAEAAFSMRPNVDGSFSWRGSILTFTPSDRLPIETAFRITVGPGVRDEAGNEMSGAAENFEFRTVGPPRVASTVPEDGAEEVALDSEIVITFTTLMDTVSVEEALRISPPIEVEASWSGEELVLIPVDQLDEGTSYRVSIGTGARDSTGTALETAHRFGFQTTRSALTPLSLVPTDGVEGVSSRTPIAVVLDRQVDPDTVEADLFSIEPEVAGTLQLVAAPGAAGLVDPTQRVLLFQPATALEPNTTYRVTVEPGARGTDESHMAEPVSWSFTTGAPLSTLSNQIVFISDRAGTANLWAMNPDGSVERQISAELSAVTDYAVAPDGRSFVVGDGAVLVRQNADGSQRTVLTPNGALDFDPAWSPDGSQLAFARADGQTGSGLGIWLLDAAGGDPSRLELPGELLRPGSPTPSPDDDEPEPMLRAPRFSPDGAALAYVDTSGWVGVVELPAARLSRAPFVAVGPPAWTSDSTSVLLAGMAEESSAQDPPEPAGPVRPLDPGSPRMTPAELASLEIVRLDRGATRTRSLVLEGGAVARPATREGQLLYIALRADEPVVSGELWLADRDGDGDRRLLDDGGAAVLSAVFGLEPRSVVAARARDGIWLVDGLTGRGERLSDDGWQPRWLP